MAHATLSDAAAARSQVEKNLNKIRSYLAHQDKLDSKTAEGLQSYLKKFQDEASLADVELSDHIRTEMGAAFGQGKPTVSRAVAFLCEKGLAEPEHWPSARVVLEERGLTAVELEKVRLNTIAFEGDAVFLIALWLEFRYGRRKTLDELARKRMNAMKQRVEEGMSHSITPVLLATVPLLFDDPDLSFLKDLLAKPSVLTEEEKGRFKELYNMAMQGQRGELQAIVAKIIDAHSELMTKAKFSIM
jgi:hypothetical protein